MKAPSRIQHNDGGGIYYYLLPWRSSIVPIIRAFLSPTNRSRPLPPLSPGGRNVSVSSAIVSPWGYKQVSCAIFAPSPRQTRGRTRTGSLHAEEGKEFPPAPFSTHTHTHTQEVEEAAPKEAKISQDPGRGREKRPSPPPPPIL